MLCVLFSIVKCFIVLIVCFIFIYFFFFFLFRQPAFDGLCLSGSLPSIHVNTDDDVSEAGVTQSIRYCGALCC